jgi:hypothetical protein
MPIEVVLFRSQGIRQGTKVRCTSNPTQMQVPYNAPATPLTLPGFCAILCPDSLPLRAGLDLAESKWKEREKLCVDALR